MNGLQRVLSWIVTLIVPVALTLGAVRVALTPAFVRFEYNTPGFPADPYGFTKEDRLYWSQIALDYLLNDAGISFLGDLRFENGAPVYNDRELRHMVDVKNAVQTTLLVWYISLGALVVLGVWAYAGGWWGQFLHGLSRGGWLTLGLIFAVLVFVLLSFGVFFVAFHEIFFEPGTWSFLWTDTLIRLFPERFWRDVFLVIGGLAMIGGLILAFGLRGAKRA